MGNEWHRFYRLATHSHALEAKIAVGGEPYGNPHMGYKASKGQWICRNPENGHCWIMDDEGMFAFYAPFDKTTEEWQSFSERMNARKKLMKTKKKPTNQEKKRESAPASEEAFSLFHDFDA